MSECCAYEMLACEDCNHMVLENSKDTNLNEKMTIPVSSTADITQLIDSVALTKEPLCLRGKSYRFNWNLFGINPAGKRFDVRAKESSEICAGFRGLNLTTNSIIELPVIPAPAGIHGEFGGFRGQFT